VPRRWPVVARKWLVVGAVALLLVGVAAATLGRELVSSSPEPSRKPSANEPPGFVRFRDGTAKLSIAHPSDWRRLPASDSRVRLLAAGDGASMLIRTVALGIPVRRDTVGAARRLTDKLVGTAHDEKLLRRPARTELGRLPGYLYLYTYRDSSTGRRAAHAHYFLFRGTSMITIVFQADPAERFKDLAPLFDRIASTFRIQPT
jgi:hypothetical protein